MANTFTSNYNLIKSEVGGDNATWGNNLHTTLDLVDLNMAKMLEDQIVSGITSSAIDLAAGSGTGIISTSANLKYFENIVVGDKVRVSGSDEAVNGTAAIPKIHTVTAKTSADSITVGTQFVDDTNTTITVAKVLEPVHINSGPIVCAPIANLSAATRAAGGAAVQGADTTDALVVNGNTTIGDAAGLVSALTITNAGSGYDVSGTLQHTGGGGTGFTGTYTQSGGAINSVTITSGGSGYTSAPNITLYPNSGSAGTGAIVHASISASTDTVSFPARVKTDFLPSADNSYDLGSSSAEWQDLWIDNVAYIDSLVADTAAISAGTISGVTSLSVADTEITMTGYTIGTNGKGNRTVSTSAPAAEAGDNGDIHYEYA